MKPHLTIGAVGLAILFLFAGFGGLVSSTEKAEAACVWRMITASGKSTALRYKTKRARAFRRAHRAWRNYVAKTYGSAFSQFGYARYDSQTFALRTARVKGVPCDANQ